MGSVYTQRFVHGALAPGANVQAIVPPGKVWIVRDFSGTTSGAVAASGPVVLQIAGINVAGAYTEASATAFQWSGRQVALAGEAVGVYNVTSVNIHVSVTGYELSAS